MLQVEDELAREFDAGADFRRATGTGLSFGDDLARPTIERQVVERSVHLGNGRSPTWSRKSGFDYSGGLGMATSDRPMSWLGASESRELTFVLEPAAVLQPPAADACNAAIAVVPS
jgi:hypothetical protein